MRRKHRKRTRKKQRGGVRFSNILTAENAHRFNKILDDDEFDEIDVYIRIIPMPWMSDSKTTLDDEDDFWVTHPMRDIRELTNNPGVVTSDLNDIEDNLAERLVDRDGSPEPFPFIEAMFSDDDRSLWHPLYRDDDDITYANTVDGNIVALKIPNNTQEVIDTLHGDRSHHIDYLIEVLYGPDTTAQISKIVDLNRERKELYEDKPDEPDKYRRANEALIRLQSRARGRNTRKKTKGLSSRRGVWEPTRNPREQMRRWTDMSRNVMEDDPMRGYEQFRIYDPIRGYQNEEIEPYDESFLETYNRIKNIR